MFITKNGSPLTTRVDITILSAFISSYSRFGSVLIWRDSLLSLWQFRLPKRLSLQPAVRLLFLVSSYYLKECLITWQHPSCSQGWAASFPIWRRIYLRISLIFTHLKSIISIPHIHKWTWKAASGAFYVTKYEFPLPSKHLRLNLKWRGYLKKKCLQRCNWLVVTEV